MTQAHIELCHHLHLAFQQFLIVFPQRKIALNKQLCAGRRMTNMRNQSHTGIKSLFDSSPLDNILSTRHQKDSLRTSVQNRTNATIHPFRIISCNATIAHMMPGQQYIPITGIFRQRIAKHHDVSTINITHGSKLRYTRLIMLRLRTRGKQQKEGEYEKDVSSHYYI